MMAEQKEPIIISVSDPGGIERDYVCLLYTSDAADE